MQSRRRKLGADDLMEGAPSNRLSQSGKGGRRGRGGKVRRNNGDEADRRQRSGGVTVTV